MRNVSLAARTERKHTWNIDVNSIWDGRMAFAHRVTREFDFVFEFVIRYRLWTAVASDAVVNELMLAPTRRRALPPWMHRRSEWPAMFVRRAHQMSDWKKSKPPKLKPEYEWNFQWNYMTDKTCLTWNALCAELREWTTERVRSGGEVGASDESMYLWWNLWNVNELPVIKWQAIVVVAVAAIIIIVIVDGDARQGSPHHYRTAQRRIPVDALHFTSTNCN